MNDYSNGKGIKQLYDIIDVIEKTKDIKLDINLDRFNEILKAEKEEHVIIS